MGKYKIYMNFPACGHRGYEEVRGYPVSIPNLEGVELFIHRPYGGSLNQWNISEMKSGLALISYCEGTRKQVVDALKAKLAGVKTDNISLLLKTMIYKHIAEFGVANKTGVGDKR